MANTHKKVTIVDPARWGLKFTEKRQWYYKMRLDFFNDPAINMLNSEQKIIFLELVKQSLRENSAELSICLEYIRDMLRVSLDSVKLSLRTLKDNNIIELDSRLRTQLIEENRIEENRSKKNFASVFDFEKLYKLYPIKKGKSDGIKKCKSKIKTQSKYDLLEKAIINYDLSVRDTDKKFIKHFSTFMNCWEDYIENENLDIRPTFDDILGKDDSELTGWAKELMQ